MDFLQRLIDSFPRCCSWSANVNGILFKIGTILCQIDTLFCEIETHSFEINSLRKEICMESGSSKKHSEIIANPHHSCWNPHHSF